MSDSSPRLEFFMWPARAGLPSLSPPCTKAFLALKFCGLEHEVIKVKGNPNKVSPSGRLPALRVDGWAALSDSVAILDRLEELSPPRPFWPEEPTQRAQDRVFEHFVNDTLYWRLAYLRWLVPDNLKRTLNEAFGEGFSLLKLILGAVAPRDARARLRGQGVGLKDRETVLAELQRGLETARGALGERDYLQGRTTPGRGDLALAAWIANAPHQGICPQAGQLVQAQERLIAHARRVFAACGCEQPESLQIAAAQ